MLNVHEKSVYAIGQNVKFYFGMRVHEGTIIQKRINSDGCWGYDIDVGRMTVGRGVYSHISEEDILKNNGLFSNEVDCFGRNYI